MSSSSPPPSDQHTTVSVFETPQSTSTFANLSPTGSSTKATENCTWEDIVVSAETTNPPPLDKINVINVYYHPKTNLYTMTLLHM